MGGREDAEPTRCPKSLSRISDTPHHDGEGRLGFGLHISRWRITRSAFESSTLLWGKTGAHPLGSTTQEYGYVRRLRAGRSCEGESTIFAMRFSALPLRSLGRGSIGTHSDGSRCSSIWVQGIGHMDVPGPCGISSSCGHLCTRR